MPGAFEGARAGIAALKREGVEFQVNTTITRMNLDQVEDLLALAQKLLGKAARVAPAAELQTARLQPCVETARPARSLDAPGSEAELGEALLALVAVARANGWDAERALRERLRGLTAQIRAAEAR